jgi:TRAP-type C4-dicarboxylate transport system substrate-binding protein
LIRFNKLRRLEMHTTNGNDITNTSYKPYKEWIKLTSEQRKEIHKARTEAQEKGIRNWNEKKTDENNKDNEGVNRYRNKKRQRRVSFQDDDSKEEGKTDESE